VSRSSPVKWHQGHTTWFFETFVLRPFLPGYKPFREEFHRLFNSYYISLDEDIPEKKLRASFSRPSLDEVTAFRAHVDREMERLFAHPIEDEAHRRIVLGLSHEQQHQELALPISSMHSSQILCGRHTELAAYRKIVHIRHPRPHG
jgi:hypothetical protein